MNSASDARVRSPELLNLIQAPLFLVKPDGSILEANESSLRRFKIAGDFRSRNFLDLLQNANEREAAKEALHRCAHAEGLQRFLSHSANWEWHCGLVPERGESKKEILLSGRDLSAEKISDQKLRDYQAALDRASIVAITDRQGVITFVNEKFCEISKYTKEELIGQTHRIINSGHHPREFFREMWRTIAGGRAWTGEICNRAKDGSLYWVHTVIIPFLGEDARPWQYMAIRTDITRQKQLAAEVIRQDRLASIGMLASGLAHEIGTPLGVIRGRAELLQIQNRENFPLKDGLGIIVHQADRIVRLISSLLRFSRSRDDLKMKSFFVREVVEEVEILIQEKLQKNDVDFVVEIDPGLRVFSDFSRLEQILVNLLINAIQAIQEKKKSVPHSRNQITIEALARDPWVELSVLDTGCGIAPEHQSKLFQPFFSTKDIGEGTGLGLSIAAKLVSEIEGEIDFESQKGAGAKFRIRLRRPPSPDSRKS